MARPSSGRNPRAGRRTVSHETCPAGASPSAYSRVERQHHPPGDAGATIVVINATHVHAMDTPHPQVAGYDELVVTASPSGGLEIERA